jgi:transcriptional regulator with XRE-family HTH domain
MSFSRQLASEKDRLGMTLAGLAVALDVGQRTVEHWLNGDRTPLDLTQEGALARLRRLKKPTRIITDPKKITRICLNQPRVSAARMRESISRQNGKPPTKPQDD